MTGVVVDLEGWRLGLFSSAKGSNFMYVVLAGCVRGDCVVGGGGGGRRWTEVSARRLTAVRRFVVWVLYVLGPLLPIGPRQSGVRPGGYWFMMLGSEYGDEEAQADEEEDEEDGRPEVKEV